MRALRVLLLILALLTGQVHACTPVFMERDGRVCAACSSAEAATSDICACPTKEVKAAKPDCRSCCKLKVDDDDGKTIKAYPTLASLVLAIHPNPPFFVPIRLDEPTVVSYHVTVHLGHGPPETSDSRAPPSLT